MEYEDEALIRTERPSPEIVPGVFSKEDRSYFARRLVFDQAPALRIERDRFYPLMRKIVQGMYLYHTGEFLSPNFRSAWNLNALLELSDDRRRMLEASQFGLVYPEVFGCRYLIVNEGVDDASVWWLCFYTDVVLRCYVPPRHLWSSLAL
jgi:hypothetical protein